MLAQHAGQLDRRFVEHCETDRSANAVLEAVVGLARGLGCDVVAEGVETAGQHAHVHAAGCAFGQGHAFAPALPAPEVEALLAALPE